MNYEKIKTYLLDQRKVFLVIAIGWPIFAMLADIETLIRTPNSRLLFGGLMTVAFTVFVNIPLILLLFRFLSRMIELIGAWRSYLILFLAFLFEGWVYSKSNRNADFFTPDVMLGVIPMVVFMGIALLIVKGNRPFVAEGMFEKKSGG